MFSSFETFAREGASSRGTAGTAPVLSGPYVAEDAVSPYVAENGTDTYVTET